MATSTSSAPAIGDYFGVLRRRFVYIATIIPATAFVCVVAAFGIRPIYQATATIMLEPSSVPKDIIESTVVSYSDQQIEVVQGRVMTVKSMLPIVHDINPYPDRPGLTADEKAQQILDDTSVDRVDPVTFKPEAESNAFSLHYNNHDPDIAKQIDARLAQLFLTYNQVRRSQAAGEAAGFLQKQAESITDQIRDNDARLAVLKNKFGDALPEFLNRNQGLVEDTQRQLEGMQQQLLTAQEKESVLAVQLSQMSPNLTTQSGDLTDIATVRAKLTEAEQRYTPDHPEVKRLRRALETLMAQSKGTPSGAIVQSANNPQYNLTAAQLQAARNELDGLRTQEAALRAKLNQYRSLVSATPVADRELSDVLRRKQALQNEYQQTQDKLQNANLAETFESQQGGERFTMLRAPSDPRSPVYPNRLGLILLGLVFGAGVAGVAVAVSESTDRNIRTARDMVLPDGLPVLASIPVIKNKRDRRRRALKLGSFIAAYSIALAVAAAVVVSGHR
jgi:polysaccharide chain length determinant protein (PEP-CTERM system associated)